MDTKTLKTIQSNFLKELRDAYAGKKTSLPFIVHQTPSTSLVKVGEIFEVLVIGGSIWKKAFCQKTKQGIEIIKKQTEQQVLFKSENDFLTFIEQEISDNTKVLALNFAYPLKPIFENNRLDGRLLTVTKEGGFHDLVGKKVGEEIEDYIFKKRKKKIKVSMANDTICLLLSGLTKYSFDNLAAGIVGTGLNFAFFLKEDLLVNLESANFDKFPQTKEAKIIDNGSIKPGRGLFEKETAGAYLYKHFNLTTKEGKIHFSAINSTEELNDIGLNRNYSSREVPTSRDESRSLKDDSSRQARTIITNLKISQIARYLLNRSAQLVACQIAGITEFKKHDMVFNMEGSLFWKGNQYRETVEQTVKQLVPKYNITFVEIKDSGILGAAKLVS